MIRILLVTSLLFCRIYAVDPVTAAALIGAGATLLTASSGGGGGTVSTYALQDGTVINADKCWTDGGGACPNGNCLDNKGRRGVVVYETTVGCKWYCFHRAHCKTQTCCERAPKPVNGNWGSWGAWSSCGGSCRKSRTRSCSNPAPQNGGAPCRGDASQETQCTGGACRKETRPLPPVNGGMGNTINGMKVMSVKEAGIWGIVLGTGAQTDCPAGWKMFNGRCYGSPENKRLSWEAAELHCQNWLSGAHLASVHSPEEQAFIVDNYPKHIWLGGTDISQEGTWDWTDGTPFDYSDWYPGEPNNHGGNQDCLSERKEHKWDDDGCEKEQFFLCKK